MSINTAKYNHLHLQQFQGVNELTSLKLFDETKIVTKSMQASISILKGSPEQSPSETLKTLYASKLSLPYHKNLSIVKIAIKFLRDLPRYCLGDEDCALATKLILYLLANADLDIQRATYVECHALVENILGVEYNREKSSWENLTFLLEPSVLTEIISHGATSEDNTVTKIFNHTFEIIRILKSEVQIMHIRKDFILAENLTRPTWYSDKRDVEGHISVRAEGKSADGRNWVAEDLRSSRSCSTSFTVSRRYAYTFRPMCDQDV